jgi:hypothetical protein
MQWPTVSTGAWKVLLSLLALFVTSLLVIEFWYAPRMLAPAAAGTLGVRYHVLPEVGPSRYVIDELAPDSPMRVAGARVGDLWVPDRFYDADRRLAAEEHIGLTLLQGEAARHVTVAARPDSHQTAVWPYLVNWFCSVSTLALGLLIGMRQPTGTASRAVALFAVLTPAFNVSRSYLLLPAGPIFLLYHLAWPVARAAVLLLALVFIFNFPNDDPRGTPLKRWLVRYVVPIYGLLWLTLLVTSTAHAAGFHVPAYSVADMTASTVAAAMALTVLWTNWRSSEGELRQKHLWVMLSTALLFSMQPLAQGVNHLWADHHSQRVAWTIVRSAALLSTLTLAYAILRHRVLNIGFAINRVMVYGAASAGMLLSFGLIEWVAHHLLDFAGREKSVWLDAGIALGIFLVFHRLRHWGEKQVERLFFHAWHVKEQALRKFVKEAPFISRPDALLSAFTAALDRFTSGAGHALYRRTPAGDYQCVAATLVDAPVTVDADEPLAVSLRASQAPVHPSDAHSALPGELALPSIHHGQLDGFVLLGTKPDGETYRPDEKDVLGFTAHQVGLDFRALRMEQLEREIAEAQQTIHNLRMNLVGPT